MSEPTEEERALEIERAREIYQRLTAALGDATRSEALQALTMATVQLCVSTDTPDRVFLETLDGALAVFRDLTNKAYRNQDPTVS